LEISAGAAVYVTCRERKHPTTIEEIVDVLQLPESPDYTPESYVRDLYLTMCDELDILLPPRHPAEYIPKFASELGVPPITQQRARQYAVQAVERNVGGTSPKTVAAVALYKASQQGTTESLTQAEVADVADLAQHTLSSAQKDLPDFDASSSLQRKQAEYLRA
jgi:transcription initiation factor TFIIB